MRKTPRLSMPRTVTERPAAGAVGDERVLDDETRHARRKEHSTAAHRSRRVARKPAAGGGGRPRPIEDGRTRITVDGRIGPRSRATTASARRSGRPSPRAPAPARRADCRPGARSGRRDRRPFASDYPHPDHVTLCQRPAPRRSVTWTQAMRQRASTHPNGRRTMPTTSHTSGRRYHGSAEGAGLVPIASNALLQRCMEPVASLLWLASNLDARRLPDLTGRK